MRTLTILLGLALSAIGLCQTAPTVSVAAPPKAVLVGSKLTLNVTVTFAPGMHGYQNPPAGEYEIPVTVKVDGKDFKVVKIAYPAGTDSTMGGSEKPTKAYQGTIKIPVTILVPKKQAIYNVKVTVGYQQCDDTTCFPPGDVSATVKVNVAKKVAKA